MDLDTITWLSSPEGRLALNGLPPYRADQALATTDALRRQGLEPDKVAALLTQSRLRSRVAERWPADDAELAGRLLFTPDGAEQATRPAVARLRARRYAQLGDTALVADLGCGIGIDTLALTAEGVSVEAFEQDAVTAAIARVNVHPTTVTDADVTALPPTQWDAYDGVFADPARRRGGRRISDPQSWSPSLSWVLSLPTPHLGVKVAPGLDHAIVPPDTEFSLVSMSGTVVEAGLYRGALRNSHILRSATVLPAGRTVTDRDLSPDAPPVAPVGRYLHEPDGAVIRAGLVGAVVVDLPGWLIDPRIAYISSDQPASPAASELVSSYVVHDVMAFSLKRLRTYLRHHGVGSVVVKKRGSAVDVDELRSSLRLDRGASDERTVFVTRIGSEPMAIVTTPLRREHSR